MKQLILLLCFLSFGVQAQDLFWEYGQSLTNFDYENSQGNTLDNLQGKTFAYFNLGTRLPLFEDKLQFTGSFNWHRYGAIGSDDALNNFFDWETSYLGIQLGLDASLITAGQFSWHVQGSAGPEFLLQGSQTLNNQVFDLTNTEDFDAPILLFRIGTHFEYEISEYLSFALSYHYGSSNTIGSDSTEELSYNVHQIAARMYFSICKGKSNEEHSNPDSQNSK